MQMYLCSLYRKLEQLLNGSQLQNAEIQSAAPDNCSCSTISPFKNRRIWNKRWISLHYYRTSRQVAGINLWERNIFKIPSSCGSKPRGPAELWSVVLVDVCDSKQKIIYKTEECLPLGKADNIITLLCNQEDFHPVGSKCCSRQKIPPGTAVSSIFTINKLFV